MDCCGYFTIWRVIQRRRTSCMKKWSPSSGLMEILPQRALQNWLTWRLVSKRACGNERVPFVSFYISRFNRESQKSDLLTTLPVIQQFISWPWACGVGEGGHWLNYLRRPIFQMSSPSSNIGHFRVASKAIHMKMCSTYGFIFMQTHFHMKRFAWGCGLVTTGFAC